MLKKLVVLVALSLMVLGCDKGEKLEPDVEKLGRATGPVDPSVAHKKMPSMVAQKVDGKRHQGEIVETMDVPNYTYIRLKGANNEMIWTAVPSSKVEKGQQVEIIESIVMSDFKSPATGKVFKSIVFGVLADSKSGPPEGDTGDESPKNKLPKGHPPIPTK